MNVGPPSEDLQRSPPNSPPPSAAAPAPDLTKYENDPLGQEETDAKLPPKTATAAVQDALLEPEKKQSAPAKEKKKKPWKKPEVSEPELSYSDHMFRCHWAPIRRPTWLFAYTLLCLVRLVIVICTQYALFLSGNAQAAFVCIQSILPGDATRTVGRASVLSLPSY